jgi:hypothetical protein
MGDQALYTVSDISISVKPLRAACNLERLEISQPADKLDLLDHRLHVYTHVFRLIYAV